MRASGLRLLQNTQFRLEHRLGDENHYTASPVYKCCGSQLLAKARISDCLPQLVGIDGVNGTGKSSLSRDLGKRLDSPVIETDSFIQYGDRHYPEILNLDELRSTLIDELKQRQVVIVEGIMLSIVLDAIDVAASSKVYVRHSLQNGTLSHSDLLDANVTETELLAKENEICRLVGIADDAPILARELITYHKRYRPYEHAHAILQTRF